MMMICQVGCKVLAGRVFDFYTFNTAVHTWDDADSYQKVPHVDCIKQEIMEDPVIAADAHSYKRTAIEK